MSQTPVREEIRGPSRDELMGRAQALVPALRERAEHAEELRRLPDETERDFHNTGLFRMLQPARWGGSELDYGALIDLGAEVARGCPSSAWNLTNLASHHWMLAMFPAQAQSEVWSASPDALIASSFVFPAGRARRVDGAYLTGGRWPFSSGVDNSDWNMLAALVGGEDEAPPEYRLFLLPKSDYRIIDNWFAAGLRGTGSKDVEAKDAFVPEHRTLAVDETKRGAPPGSAVNPGPLYRVAVFAMFPYVLSGVALGTAQGAFDDFTGAMRSRASRYTGAKLASLQTVQIRIAESAARIDAAALIMRGNCAEAMAFAEAGKTPDIEAKVKYRRDGAYSVRLCVEAVDLLFGASGAGALYTNNPIQRAFRDMHAISAHIAFSME
ncbi:MAG: acyl-CoA dehydrogenase family protein, partial [Geminicoccales bacterium]